MIQQPQLGQTISNLRKAKGFTQEELVEKCNLSVRTLQRIEAGDVTPRTYTIRLIFDALELDYNNSLNAAHEQEKGLRKKWLEQFYIHFTDLFNLKTHTMKKITILTIAIFTTVFGITSLTNESFAQSDSRVKAIIEKNNSNFITWFNNGETGLLLELYREDACLISEGCGKEFIKNYYDEASSQFKFTEIKATSISVNDTIALEKGTWRGTLNSGETIGGDYFSEWKLTNKTWLISSESSGLAMN